MSALVGRTADLSHAKAFVDGFAFDFVRETARELGSHVVFHLLGVPEADRSRITSRTWENGSRNRETERAAYFHKLVAAKQSSPGRDVLSALSRPASLGIPNRGSSRGRSSGS